MVVSGHRDLILALAGGKLTPVANMLSTPEQQVHRRDVWWWVHRGQPDKKWRPQLLALADKLGINVDPEFRKKWAS